jgi:hypothetical protein
MFILMCLMVYGKKMWSYASFVVRGTPDADLAFQRVRGDFLLIDIVGKGTSRFEELMFGYLLPCCAE